MGQRQDDTRSIVQFNVVNITANPITVDLFDLATLNTTPTQPNYISPPNSIVQTFGSSVYLFIAVSNNGNIYVVDNTLFVIEVYDSNYNLIASPSIFPTSINCIVYNSNQNQLYVYGGTGRIFILDCNTNTYIINFITPYTPIIGTYNSLSNTIYYYNGSTFNIVVLDCNSLTFTSILSLPIPFLAIDSIIYNPNNNIVYFISNLNLLIGRLDCSTNTYLSSITKTFAGGRIDDINVLENSIYISNTFNIEILNCSTNNITTLNVPVILNQGSLDTFLNELYYTSVSGDIVIINASNNTLISITPLVIGSLFLCSYNPINNDFVFSNPTASNLIQYTTLGITTTPYYVTGATNYNYFVQNLQNEPIIVYKIRTISPQTQLDNVANILKIDSSGIQSQYPIFPINSVSAWQEQGNISEINFKGLVLDGRTYVSNYVINANTTVILEIHYEQLDNTKIRYLGQFLPKKVPLKGFFDDYVDVST
jgi:hypothetical protein